MEYPCAPACWWWRKIPRIGLDVISETLLPLVGRVASNNQGDESDCSGSTHNDPAQRPGPRDAWIATRARWPGSLQRMVRHHITDESMFRYAENAWLPSRLIPH